MSDIGTLLLKSRKLMAVIGVETDPAIRVYTEHLNAAVMGLMIEAGEVGDEINTVTRPWNKKPVEAVRARMIEETIDVLFYLLEIWNMLGLSDDEIQFRFETKLDINFKRVASTFRPVSDIELAVREAMSELDSTPSTELMDHWFKDDFDYDSYRHHPLKAAVAEILWNVDTLPSPASIDRSAIVDWILRGGRK